MHVRCLLPFPDTRPLSNQLRGNWVIRWSRGRGVGGELASYSTRACKATSSPTHTPSFPLLPIPLPTLSFQSFLYFLSLFQEAADAGRLAAKQVRPLQLKLPEIPERDDESAVCFRTHPLLDMLLGCRVSPPLPRESVLRAAG